MVMNDVPVDGAPVKGGGGLGGLTARESVVVLLLMLILGSEIDGDVRPSPPWLAVRFLLGVFLCCFAGVLAVATVELLVSVVDDGDSAGCSFATRFWKKNIIYTFIWDDKM